MPDVTLTFDLNVETSFSPIGDQLAEHKVTISDVETTSAEDLRAILHAAIDEIARLAHAAVDAEEEDHD